MGRVPAVTSSSTRKGRKEGELVLWSDVARGGERRDTSGRIGLRLRVGREEFEGGEDWGRGSMQMVKRGSIEEKGVDVSPERDPDVEEARERPCRARNGDGAEKEAKSERSRGGVEEGGIIDSKSHGGVKKDLPLRRRVRDEM